MIININYVLFCFHSSYSTNSIDSIEEMDGWMDVLLMAIIMIITNPPRGHDMGNGLRLGTIEWMNDERLNNRHVMSIRMLSFVVIVSVGFGCISRAHWNDNKIMRWKMNWLETLESGEIKAINSNGMCQPWRSYFTSLALPRAHMTSDLLHLPQPQRRPQPDFGIVSSPLGRPIRLQPNLIS